MAQSISFALKQYAWFVIQRYVVSSHTYRLSQTFSLCKILCVCVCSIHGYSAWISFQNEFYWKWSHISLITKKAHQCYRKFNVREYPIEHWHIWISEWWACGFYGRVFASHSHISCWLCIISLCFSGMLVAAFRLCYHLRFTSNDTNFLLLLCCNFRP